jgi:hypothetical protein
MQTVYLFVVTALGGLLALFSAAGWSSYKDQKLPATSVLFRWFIAGVVSTGLAGYTWLFGAGGDPSKLMESLGDALEVKQMIEGLTSAVGTAGTNALETASSELTVGMPTF